MSDTVREVSQKDAFIQQKKTKADKVLVEAQRLVNMYRQMDAFGPDFGARLDALLKTISPEVEMALSDIQGGTTVRRYCEFLKGNDSAKGEGTEMEADSQNAEGFETAESKWSGYLPSPEEDIPMPETASVSSGGGVTIGMIETLVKSVMETHQTELVGLLKSQNEFMDGIMQKLDKNTHDVATHQTDRLINALQQEVGKQKQYADVIESPAQQSVLVPEDMEGF